MSILLKSIVEEPELHFVIRGNIITFIPRISMIISDMLEANKFANVYQPSSSRRPCRKCLVLNDNLNDINLTGIIPRTPDAMKQAITSGNEQYYSIHPENNAFWDLRYEILGYYFIISYYIVLYRIVSK
jgi:hypothetical protein